MKFLIMTKPKQVSITPEAQLQLIKASREMIPKLLDNGTLECIYTYPQLGGIAIVNVSSHEELMDLLMNFPESTLFNYEIKPLVRYEHAYEKLISAFENR
jgi:muconolactone delta-isomerase